MTQKNKPKDPKDVNEKTFLTDVFYIGCCSACEWHIRMDNAKDCLAQMNEHHLAEHQGEAHAMEEMAMFVSNRQVELGIERTETLVLGVKI